MDPNRPNYNKLKNPALLERFKENLYPVDSKLFQLKFLNLERREVGSLEDLELFTKLQKFHCDRTNIVSLAPIAGLSELAKLYIGGNPIVDLTPLVDCPRLEELVIGSYCPIRSFEPLRQMPQLKKLVIINELLPVLKAAGELPHLKQLMVHDDVQSVRDLPEMPNLRVLYFWNSKINDLEGVQRYSDLVNIFGQGEQIRSVEPLSSCLKMTHINLWIGPEVDLQPLLNLPELRTFECATMDRAALECLTSLPKLRELSYFASKPTLSYDHVRSWDEDFACDTPLFRPSTRTKRVTEEEIRYFDQEHPFKGYDWNEEMLVSEHYWMVANIKRTLSTRLTDELTFGRFGPIRRSISLYIENVGEDDVMLDWIITQIQKALCRGKKTWIVYLNDDDSARWVYPDHVEIR